MKLLGIKLLNKGRVQGIFVVMLMKILFWLCVIEVAYIWIPKYLIYVLPIVFLLFLWYVFMEKNLFFKSIKGNTTKEKEEALQ